MRLLEFFSLIRPLRGDGPLSRDVNGVAWDARRVQPGNLFVAIPGPGRDTQAAVDLAVERGAVAILCEGREVVSLRVTRIQVENLQAILPRVAELFFSQPDRRLKVIGVIGGSGISATAALLKSVLDAGGFKCGMIGAVGCEIGERHLPPLRKGAEVLDYFDLMAQMVRTGCGACIIEISPEAIDDKRFAGIAFDAAIFNGFAEESMSGRGSALVQFCRAQAMGPKRFVGAFNIDDEIGRALFESRAAGQQLSFGFNAAAEVRGSALELTHGSLGMIVAAGGGEIRLRTRLTGRINAERLLAACAGAAALRIPLALMRFTLQKTAPPSGSLEAVGAGAVSIYVDSARSESDIAASLESLREITSGRVLVVIGSAAGESFEQRHHLGRMAARLADYAVVTNLNPGRESGSHIAAQIERGYTTGARRDYHIELDRAQAIHDLIGLAQPGDAVLITGKGHERHQEFADTIVPFDDREHALAALEMRSASSATPAATPILFPTAFSNPPPLAAA